MINKLIFTLDEIKAACPDITDIAGAIEGFGLLPTSSRTTLASLEQLQH